MQGKTLEVTVGLFVALGLAALVMLAIQVSNLGEYGSGDTYQLTARFDNVGGLKARSPVMVAGVRVGQVSEVRIDRDTYEAVVTLELYQRYDNLPVDTSASIFTSGLLGEQYLALEPGGDEQVLRPGDEIRLTQSAMVLEQVIGQVLFSKAAGDE